MQLLCRLLDLLGVELACLAGPDEVGGVSERRGPKETLVVRYAHERAR